MSDTKQQNNGLHVKSEQPLFPSQNPLIAQTPTHDLFVQQEDFTLHEF